MAEFNRNIWAPWRMEYIDGITAGEAGAGCFLCEYRDQPQGPASQYVLWRGTRSLVLLNRFPYTTGHLLVAPLLHVAEPEDLPEEVHHELIRRLVEAQRVLRKVLHPGGFNIGMNLGQCAGAGLPGHVHWHLVPRWSGDTNFMPVLDDVRVIPQALQRIREQFLAASAELGLPGDS